MASDNRTSITSRKTLDLDSIMVGIEEYLNDADSQEVEVNIVDDEKCEPLSLADDIGDEVESMVDLKENTDAKQTEVARAIPSSEENTGIPAETKQEEVSDVAVDERDELEAEKVVKVTEENTEDAVEEIDPEMENSSPATEKAVKGLSLEANKSEGVVEDEANEPGTEGSEETVTKTPLGKFPTETKQEKAEDVVQDEADELEAEDQEGSNEVKEVTNAEDSTKGLLTSVKHEKTEEIVQEEASELEADKPLVLAEEAPAEVKKEETAVTVEREAGVPEADKPPEVVAKMPGKPPTELKAGKILTDAENLARRLPSIEKQERAEEIVQDEADELEAERSQQVADEEPDELEVEKPLAVVEKAAKSLFTETTPETTESVEGEGRELKVAESSKIAQTIPPNLTAKERGNVQQHMAEDKADVPAENADSTTPPLAQTKEEKISEEPVGSTVLKNVSALSRAGDLKMEPLLSVPGKAAKIPAAGLVPAPDMPDTAQNVTHESDSAKSALDRETEELLRELEQTNPHALSARAYNETLPIYIYTSLAGGGYHMIPRTNRLATILTANRVTFEYRDLGTDPHARSVWKTHAAGKTLPGVVRGDRDVIGDWQDIDDANESYALRDLLYDTL